ncbi:hypothetical protein QOZ80_1AG0023800 [Eleusine coracana subsp. coracana]|nr:hypothetical protein QOZ80_1AG0023800 [Eleusine coracana subsp. coracana]
MLPLQAAILACTIMLARSPAALGFASDGRKCRCFMCVCDFDPHPLPPELPVHHYPPPAEPEHHPSPPPPPPALPEPHYYPPPVEHEPVPGEYHYYPPPAYGYYPSVGLPYYPPAGDMYPRDKASSKSGAHRQRGPTRLLLAVVVVLASAALSSSLLQAPSAYYC